MIGVLESEVNFWPEFQELDSESATAVIRDSDLSFRANWRRLPTSIRIVRRFRDIPKRHAFIASQLLDRGIKVLISTDRPISLLNSLAETCGHVHQILVAHTTIQPMNTPRLKETHPFERRKLLVWGSRDVKLIREVQPKFRNIKVVGSLRNAGYLRRKSDMSMIQEARVCLISSHLGATKEESRRSRPMDPRFLLRERLIELAKLASDTQNLPIHIAMKPATMGPFESGEEIKFSEEVDYYSSRLKGFPVSFNNPRTRYATYKSIDASSLVIGLPTGALIEALGRGSRSLTLDTKEFQEFSAVPSVFATSGLTLSNVRHVVELLGGMSVNDIQAMIRPHMDFGTEPRAHDVLSTLARTLSS